jgi:hypothetical protein
MTVLRNRVYLGLDTETLLCYVPISREFDFLPKDKRSCFNVQLVYS